MCAEIVTGKREISGNDNYRPGVPRSMVTPTSDATSTPEDSGLAIA
jgi:hypothetical protein